MRTLTMATTLVLMMATPGLADPGSDDQQTVWGTSGAHVKGLFGVGVALCTNNQGLPTDCDQPVSQRGLAFFGVSTWDGTQAGRELTVWAQQVTGTGTGFAITVCSDVNDDWACAGSDFLGTAYSNTVDTGGDGCDKGEKDCGDPTTAGLTVCVPVDDDGDFDELVVFVRHYADAETTVNDDVGAGVSEGEYDVSLGYGSYVASC